MTSDCPDELVHISMDARTQALAKDTCNDL